jgi:HlyD family secretion protein
MQVETRIDEADIGRIHSGLPVTFSVDAYPDMEFRGEVTQVRLEPIVEQGVVTYTTVIRTQNRDLKLRPGMTANVTVLVHEGGRAQGSEAAPVPAGRRGRRRAPAARSGGRGGRRRPANAATRNGRGPGRSARRRRGRFARRAHRGRRDAGRETARSAAGW